MADRIHSIRQPRAEHPGAEHPRAGRSRRMLAAAVIPLLAVACADDGGDRPGAQGTGSPTGQGLTVRLVDGQGADAGTVSFRETGDGVVVRASVTGLTPGFHGFHVHAVGRCDGPDFASAGGHFTGGSAAHGDHDGDLPPLLADDAGRAELEVRTRRFTMQELDDTDGAAIVVHAGPDNLANIPQRYGAGPDDTTRASGDSGNRVACGVIHPAEGSPSPAGTTSPATTSPTPGSPAATPTGSPTPLGTVPPTTSPSP